ncbi:MAG TPA: hypothetical protein VMW24_24940 [Sedimentisphaerales bacterium]|nr:hypothetical protein [Sedimentisphaerales bacterium]
MTETTEIRLARIARFLLDALSDRYNINLDRYPRLELYQAKRKLDNVLADMEEGQRALLLYEAWKLNPSLGRPYSEIRQELVEEGLLDDDGGQ